MSLAVRKSGEIDVNKGRGVYVAIGLFCVVSIATIWAYTFGDIRYDRNEAIEHELSENANLALAFEEDTKRILKNAEYALWRISDEYARQGGRQEVQRTIQRQVDNGLIDTSVLRFIGVYDGHARLTLGTREFKPVDAANREFFQFHLRHPTDQMQIGKPILVGLGTAWVVPLSRRINKPDGSFAGVAYASLDPGYFNGLFNRAMRGEQRLALLVGLDGIIRARRAGHINSTGEDLSKASMLVAQSKNPIGNFASAGAVDGVPRFISYRTMTQYPLIVAVGSAQAEILAPVYARERSYYLGAGLSSGGIAVFGCVLIFFLSRQRRGIEALNASNARFGVAFNQAAVGIAMVALDGRLREVNAKLCGMLGYAKDELLTRNYLDITHPDDRKISQDHMDRLLAGLSTDKSPLLEKRYVRNNGSHAWAAVTVALVRDTYGNPDYFMAVIQDNTDYKRAQLVLADNERRVHALIENALDLIVITDREGVITFISPSVTRLAGYAARELVGRSFLDFTHPQDVLTTRAAIGKIIQTPRSPHTVSSRFRHKDGSWLILEFIASNLLEDPLIEGIVVNGRDVTLRAQEERTLRRVNRTLKALSSCNGILIRADSEAHLVQQMCDNIVNVGGYRLAWVGIVENDEKKSVRPVAYAGYEAGFIEQSRITWADNENGRGPAGTAIRTRKWQVVQNVYADPAYRLWLANAEKLGYRSVVAFPLLSFNEVMGVLTIYASIVDAFDAEEMQLLEELADDLAFGMVALRTRIAQQGSVKRLQRSMEGTILAMAATLEMRDAYTAGHQRRVAELAVAIAREMGWPEDEIHGLYLAAVVHDLGKIQIPAEILSKPARLTRIEYELIKTHPGAGYNILKEVDFPWPIAQMVYQHHERLDGSGYPQGLKDAEILPGAKILAVADTVEAMASHRPYRAGLGIDIALAEIEQNRGRSYDAAAGDACVRLFREKRFAFSK